MAITAPTDVVTFANAAARDSRMPAPAIGQGCWLIDSGSLLWYFGPSIGWRQAWNQHWDDEGRFAAIAVSSAVIAGPYPANTPIAGLAVTFAPVAGRQYVAEFEGAVISALTTELIGVYIDASAEFAGCGASALHFASATAQVLNPATAPTPLRFVKRFVTTSNAPLTFSVSATQLSGTLGQVYADACNSSTLRIVDVGPAANPTYR